MKIIKNIMVIILTIFLVKVWANPVLKYESIEHKYLGSTVILKYLDLNGKVIEKSGGQELIKKVFTGSDYVDLTFAELIYLSGDFVSDPATKIFYNETDVNNYEKIFKQNFAMYDKKFKGNFIGAKEDYVGSFIPKIREVMQQEQEKNQQAIDNHQPIKIDEGDDLRFSCATGGGCKEQRDLLAKKGLYAVSSIDKGSDHFGNNARNNYITGHRLAIKTALAANNIDELNKAYAYEGYAQHFLTDIFASGHMRTPIDELVNLPNESELNVLAPIIKPFGVTKQNILLSFAKIMHDEDNKDGLWVRTPHNQFPWLAFGDKSLFIAANSENVKNLKLAMQFAVDQIFDAYQKKSMIKSDNECYLDQQINEMKNYLPDLDFVKLTSLNPTPKYAVINNNLYEPRYRDWSNGSTGSLCGLNRNLESIIQDKNLSSKLKWILSNYCNTTINGFAKTWNWVTNDNQVRVTENNGLLTTSDKVDSDGYFHVRVNYDKEAVKNNQEFYVYPILTDKNNNRCTFKYPIKVVRYGMYTSLDQKRGNSAVRGVTLGQEYIDCKKGSSANNLVVYYKASKLNKDNFFGISPKAKSYNVELCSDGNGLQYLSNKDNSCQIWH